MRQEQWQQYIDNTGTPEERKAMLQWLQQQQPEVWEQMLAAGWEADSPPMPAAADQRLLAALTAHTTIQPVRKVSRLLWWSVAASIALLLSSIGRWTQRPAPVKHLAVTGQQLHNTSSRVRLVTLPEGSRVWLTPDATLTIPSDFNTNARHLRLKGEAYFEVTPSPGQPFVVHTGSLQTTVLGTHFNIEAYDEEAAIKVSLSAGKVAVNYMAANGQGQTLLLMPGTRVVYRTVSKAASIEHFLPSAEAAWQRGALVLNNVPLAAALHRLEMRFNKKILYTPLPGEKKYFTATYEDIPLEVILRNMAFIHGFHYQLRGDTVIIH